METITVPITHAPINITPIIITAVIVFLVLGAILLIRTRKFMDAKDSTTLSFLLVMLLLIPFNIGASAYVQKTPETLITTQDIQTQAKEIGYTYYEHTNKTTLQEPTDQEIRATPETTFSLVNNTTGQLCWANYDSTIFDTEHPTPKEYIYTITCNKTPEQ